MTTPTTPPVPPAPAPTTPVASTAAPAASTAPTASTPTTPVAPPPPPAPPEPPEDDDEVRSGWPTWAVVLLSSVLAVVVTVLVFWLAGAFTISAKVGSVTDPTPQVVVQTVIVEATAAMPEATAEPTAAMPEATAQPIAEPTAQPTAVMPTATAQAQPTKAAPPKATAAPPAPTQVPPTAVPPAPAPTAYAYNSYASGSTVAPAGAVCWGDQITLDGTQFGDGVGPGNPVWTVLSKETSVSLIWGACSTGESWETISQRLASDPATKGKTFIKVP